VKDKTLSLVIGFLVMVPINLVIYGWILSKLWLWLIVPTFGVQPLKVMQAIGINLVIGFVTLRSSKEEDEAEDDDREPEDHAIEIVKKLVAIPGAFLLLGWVISNFL